MSASEKAPYEEKSEADKAAVNRGDATRVIITLPSPFPAMYVCMYVCMYVYRKRAQVVRVVVRRKARKIVAESSQLRAL
jgi:hypothetical protein